MDNTKVKIGILTFHCAYNYGAVLQCYALNYAFNRISNVVCETIDYQPEYFVNGYQLKPYGMSIRHPHIKGWINYYKTRDIARSRNKHFSSFINRYIPISTDTYHNKTEIDKATLDYDIYVTGSDQVFNLHLTESDPTYFLYIEPARKRKKCSYAASFGESAIPSEYVSKEKEMLYPFKHISVREKTGQQIIRQLLQRDSLVSCDPTLLLDKVEWSLLTRDYRNEKYKTNSYILIY